MLRPLEGATPGKAVGRMPPAHNPLVPRVSRRQLHVDCGTYPDSLSMLARSWVLEALEEGIP